MTEPWFAEQTGRLPERLWYVVERIRPVCRDNWCHTGYIHSELVTEAEARAIVAAHNASDKRDKAS